MPKSCFRATLTEGVIADFDEVVGLGHVETPTGERYLFHCTQIADGSRTIVSGVEVAFEVVERWKGPEAYAVTAI